MSEGHLPAPAPLVAWEPAETLRAKLFRLEQTLAKRERQLIEQRQQLDAYRLARGHWMEVQSV